MRVIGMMRMTCARRKQAETRRHTNTHAHTHMQTTCSCCGGAAGTMCTSCSSGTSDAFVDVCSCTRVCFGGSGVYVAAASPCSLPALSGAFVGVDAAAPRAVAVDPAVQPRAHGSHSAGVGARRAYRHAHDTRECVWMRRFCAWARRVPPGDCGAFGSSGGASLALSFLLLLVLLLSRPSFLSCSSDSLGDAYAHGRAGTERE